MISESRIGVFFDIDNTLLPSPSLEWRFAEWLIASNLIARQQISEWVRQALFGSWSEGLKGISTSKGYLAGLPTRVVQSWKASLGAGELDPFQEAAERLDEHLARGHRAFLISGTLAPLADVFADEFDGCVDICATALQKEDDDTYTGRIAGQHMSGREKARALEEAAYHYAIDLRKSYAYGDSLNDLAMLECVGNPAAVNPCRKLRRIAASRRWEIIEWTSIDALDVSRARHFSATENGR
ncbi:MAG TPA: HAD-IB family hydrolase [Candidatus Acidoferrales bacterium]